MSIKQESQQSGRKTWYLKNGNQALDLRTLPRCQAIAKTTGKKCKNPAMNGKDVCCVHAGLYKPGPPRGNKNGWKHGFYSKAYQAELRETKRMVAEIAEFTEIMKSNCKEK